MRKTLRVLVPVLVVSALIVIGWWLISEGHFAVLDPAGDVAAQQKKLLLFACILSAAVVIPVFTMLGLFAWHYREGNKKANYQPEWGSNNKLELLWWGIPIIIIMILGFVTWRTSHELDPYKKLASENSTINVQVVALQWKWLFIYPDYGVASINQLAMPVNHPVSFRLAADAPMSAFWIPQLGSQIYSMNGMESQLNLIATKPGTYKGYNTNINGKGYADMTFDVKATDMNGFQKWVKAGQGSPNMLTLEEYAKLVDPGTMKPKQYMLMDQHLFDTIVAKYMNGQMSGQSGSTSDTNTSQDDSSMDMSGHDMSQMNMQGAH